MSWAANSRSAARMSGSPRRWRPWPTGRPTGRHSGRTNPTAVPSPASMRVWRRRHACSTTQRCFVTLWAMLRPMPMPPSCGPSSTCSTARSRRTARPSWRAGVCAICDARSTSSASIWPASTCARTPMCTSARSASCSRPLCPGTGYAELAEDARTTRLLEELATARPAGLPLPGLFRGDDARSWRSFRAAAEARRLYGPAAVTNCVISKADGVSDVLEVALLLKEVGLLRPREGGARPQHRSPVRDDPGPAQLHAR